MMKAAIERLRMLCDSIPPLLRAMDERDFSERPAPGKWSKKEIIGHLIDSATNNHHRFVRGQFEEQPRIVYDQDAWNEHSYYHLMPGAHVINFWECYNRHLLELISRIPDEFLERCVRTGGESSYTDDAPAGAAPTIAFLIDDYVAHMEHHLRQIVSY